MDTSLRAIVAAVLGLAIGSFLTVVVDRVPKKESIVSPRSRCPHCGAEIRNRDNIPVLSWLILRGRCRSCKAHVSARYPLLLAVPTMPRYSCAMAPYTVIEPRVLSPYL